MPETAREQERRQAAGDLCTRVEDLLRLEQEDAGWRGVRARQLLDRHGDAWLAKLEAQRAIAVLKDFGIILIDPAARHGH